MSNNKQNMSPMLDTFTKELGAEFTERLDTWLDKLNELNSQLMELSLEWIRSHNEIVQHVNNSPDMDDQTFLQLTMAPYATIRRFESAIFNNMEHTQPEAARSLRKTWDSLEKQYQNIQKQLAEVKSNQSKESNE